MCIFIAMKLQKSGSIPAGPLPLLKPSKEKLTRLPADGEVVPIISLTPDEAGEQAAKLITKKVLAQRYSVSTRTVQN